MTELADRLEEVQNRDAASPCGSFTFAYHCMCDYYGVPFSEEVAWVGTVLSTVTLDLGYCCFLQFKYISNFLFSSSYILNCHQGAVGYFMSD